jgi:hypothetical protein
VRFSLREFPQKWHEIDRSRFKRFSNGHTQDNVNSGAADLNELQRNVNAQLSNHQMSSVDADRANEIARRFCVLVAASDRAKDIFEIAFQNAELIWRDCKWPRYVGFTTKQPDLFGFKSLAAKTDADWRGRLGDYLDALPDDIRHVMLIVEDFLFTHPVDGSKLNAIADHIVRNDLAYVRLTPVCRNFFGQIPEYFRRMIDRRLLRPLPFSEPYYSSVLTTIWRRDYLRSLLRQPGTVWEFEHAVSTERHYAVWHPAVKYEALVGREKWYREAPRLLEQQGLSLGNSKRERQTLQFELRRIRERFSFQMFGYLSFRIRRRLNRVPRS